ncbi:MAG: prefoldin subunit beta [Candidatus Lokiarchaeia archaeon]
MSGSELPPQVQHQISMLQQLQQKLEIIITQRTQSELQLKETEQAISELEKIEHGSDVYKMVGTLLIKTQPEKVSEELKDKKETLELRVKTLQRQEERSRKQLEEMRAKVQETLQQRGLSPAG